MGVLLLFLLALAFGTLTTLYWVPEDDLGAGYFKVNGLVVLGLLTVAGLLYGAWVNGTNLGLVTLPGHFPGPIGSLSLVR